MANMNAVGVVVARFQVSSLHSGHLYLVGEVLKKHADLLIVLGCCLPRLTRNDPLDFETRKKMILAVYPQVRVVAIDDQASDAAWCNNLDEIIRREYPDRPAVLYGSRDSFLKIYRGEYQTCEIEPFGDASGTTLRESLAAKPSASVEFRAGVIYAASQRFPTSYQIVDLAIVKPDLRQVLLVRKAGSEKLWFLGGFVDPTDQSLEMAAHREMREEVGFLEIHGIRYVGSTHVEDWRYRGREDGIMTAFFIATYVFGMVRPADDIVDAVWVAHEKLEELVDPAHQPLVRLLRAQYPNWTK